MFVYAEMIALRVLLPIGLLFLGGELPPIKSINQQALPSHQATDGMESVWEQKPAQF